jgi:hypothetical protein
MLELLPCPNTNSDCCVVSTLLCRLKHRRHHIEMQSLCLANGAIATGILSFTTRYFQESSNRNFMVVGRHANFLLTTRILITGCFRAQPPYSDQIPTLLLHHSEAHYPRQLLWDGLADTGTPLEMCFTMVHRRGFEPTLATLKGW